jgi:hypothetical protein
MLNRMVWTTVCFLFALCFVILVAGTYFGSQGAFS